MTRVRLGAVAYLNARPLVEGLAEQTDRFDLRFDAPSTCAALLQAGDLDLGMIPSIEYLRAPDYRIVPDVAITSRGAVASVALFTSRPVREIRSIALDSSSRTSAGLLRVLCARRFGIAPSFVTRAPDFGAMLAEADAALIIGDPALFVDHAALGLEKVDLGAAWTDMTGLPFVWAVWAGRPDAIDAAGVGALQAARDAGVAGSDAIADAYCGPARADVGRAYLRQHIKYGLGVDERAGLERYYALAAAEGLVPEARRPRFFC